MTFVSREFLFLLIATAVLVAFSKPRFRSWLIVAASYVFYGWWDYRFIGLLLVSSAIDYICGLLCDPERQSDAKLRRVGLIASIVSNLSILCVFKYFGFFLTGLSGLGKMIGVNFVPPPISLTSWPTWHFSPSWWLGRSNAEPICCRRSAPAFSFNARPSRGPSA